MIIHKLRLLMLLDLNKSQRISVVLSSLSNIIIFFDFLTFSFMSLYIDKTFLSNTVFAKWSTFLLFCIFLTGYLVRPIGMVIYDKYAKNNNIEFINLYTILLITSYLSICFIPTKDLMNYSCIAILFSARLIHGLASGTEVQSQYNLLSYNLREKSSYSIIGILVANDIGKILGLSENKLINGIFSEQTMETFGWRIPFFISAVLTFFVYFLRIRIINKYQTNKNFNKKSQIILLFKQFPIQSIIAITISGLNGCVTFLIILFIPYLLFNKLNYGYEEISNIILNVSIISIILGYIGFKFVNFNNAPKVMVYCNIILVPCLLFWFWAFMNDDYILISMMPLATISCFLSFLVPRIISGLFPTNIRLIGVGFCFQSGFIIFGGLSPLFTIIILHFFYHFYHNISIKLVILSTSTIYILIVTMISFISLCKIKKYANYDELNLVRNYIQNKMKNNKFNFKARNKKF